MAQQIVEITLPADLEFSSFVRETSKVFFLQIGFSEDWAERLKLVLDELFTNAYKYGSEKMESKIHITLTFDEENTYFKVEDEGRGEVKVSVEGLKSAIDRNAKELNNLGKKSGRGLALISTLWTDELTLEDSSKGGLSVGFKKKISKEIPLSPPTFDLASASAKRIEKVVHTSQVSVMPEGPTQTIPLEGEIHSGNIEEKIQPIISQLATLPEGGVLVLECHNLHYFNSTFIGHLASWYNKIKDRDGHIVLKNTSKEIRSVLNLVGLSHVVYVDSAQF